MQDWEEYLDFRREPNVNRTGDQESGKHNPE
jgi:hypothetical protein